MNSCIEIRTLNLKPGTRGEFQRLYLERSLPLLKRWGHDVVAHGPSLHDDNTYYVIRRFDSLAQREQLEDAFYGSDDWRKGPREAILVLIESYTDIVLELDEQTIAGLRRLDSPHEPHSTGHSFKIRAARWAAHLHSSASEFICGR